MEDQAVRQMTTADDADSRALLRQILDQTAREARASRVMAVCSAAMAVILLVAAIAVVPPILRTLGSIDKTLEQASQTVEELDALVSQAQDSMSEADKAIRNIDDTVTVANDILVENAESLQTAMEEISKINFKELNQSIEDLHTIVEPLAKVMGVFGGEKK